MHKEENSLLLGENVIKSEAISKKQTIGDIQRAIIFGHNGFIGSNLEKYLRNQTPEIELFGKSYPPFDLTNEKDASSLEHLFDKNTTVIMLSALKKEHGDNIENFSKNIEMVKNLCNIIEKNPIKHFIFFSSAAVYGEDINNTNITEDTQIFPTSYYGMAKYTSERLLSKTVNKQKGMDLTILRPPVIYGPGDQPCYGPSGFIKSFLNEEKITLWGDGTEMREFIFIGDVVNFVHKLIFQPYNGVINFASGNSHSFTEILELISSITKLNVEINSKKRTKEKVDHHFNNELIHRLFPKLTFTPIKEGIEKTIEYYQLSNKVEGVV